MVARGLIGSRIRERRVELGRKQAGLAADVGISPAYLNLIEHNRRRIGGKLLLDIAQCLEVDPEALSTGAEAGRVAALREAALRLPDVGADPHQADDLARRYPTWAALISEQSSRISALEQTVEGLSDRLTHDPHLAASLHEVLSTVTAIRSTSAILADAQAVDPEWQDRFHRNLYEDSQRLADSSRALVGYLDTQGEHEATTSSPQEEVEAWLRAEAYHLEALEGGDGEVGAVIAAAPQVTSASARNLARRVAERYLSDAQVMPAEAFCAAARACDFDPLALAERFRADLAAVLRRVSAFSPDHDMPTTGLVCADSSGTMTYRKQIDGFALPRFGAACPLWPLYQSLSRPMTPIKAVVETPGRDSTRFLTYAIAQPQGASAFDAPPVFEATMLIVADGGPAAIPGQSAQRVGSSCRVCPREACAARREQSMLSQGI